ncbi:MAG: L-seryl-tRNA(Sec) selenium transferase [Moorellales bacterium]
MPPGSNLDALRRLPAVERVLQQPAVAELLSVYPRRLVVEAVREVLGQLRARLRTGERQQPPSPEEIASLVADRVRSGQGRSLRRVINATGVVLHTNLGRAPLSARAREAVLEVASHYCNLEMDLAEGRRGSRQDHVASLLRCLTGAEAALVVNNNAAAVLLALTVLASGREVVVSRGQLVEIGGSFRLPEIMAASGARLVEVGTVNRTYPADYERAVGPNTALLLRVHTSNFRVVGFTHETRTEELVALGRRLGLPVMEDLGSGLLLPREEPWFREEPVVSTSVSRGVDVVTFSADKLLGGPQAGIILGRAEYLERMRRHPLARALRIDKLSLAALEATLRSYLDEDRAREEIPILKALTLTSAELEERAGRLGEMMRLAVRGRATVAVRPGLSEAGGGALPGAELPTFLVEVRPVPISAQELARRLRQAEPPVVARVQEGALVLDVRTLLEGEEALLARALGACLEED